MLLDELVRTTEACASTRSRLAKVEALADLLRRLEPAEIATAVGLLSAKPRQGRVGIGWRGMSAAMGEPAATPEAQSMIRRAVGEGDLATRRHLLPALVDIELAAADVEAAVRGAAELEAFAREYPKPMVRAAAAQADGAVRLAADDPAAAAQSLRQAWRLWQQLGVPYEAARCRVLIGCACRALGDEPSALMDFEAAHAEFLELGAAPAAAWAASLMHAGTDTASRLAGPLTPREIEVLRLVASGKGNRAIAGELYLSEKTVARHVSNIFLKLGLSSRAAATSYAYEHGLAGQSTA